MINLINPNVPSGAQIPDTYLYISTAPTSISTDQPKDLFLVATAILTGSQITYVPYSLTAGTAKPNAIEQYSDVSRVNLAFGRRSPIANRFRSALQEVPIGINIFLASVLEPSNTGFAGTATRLLTFLGTAAGSGEIRIRVAGFDVFVPVANGDPAATIAAAAKSAIDKSLDVPMVTTSLIGSATVPLTYVTRGADGNDVQIEVEIPPEITGVSISPGTITITTNALGQGGSPSLFILQCDSTTYVVSIPVGTTPTNAAVLIAAAINATTGPLSATSSAGVVTLIHSSGWYAKKLQMSSTEDVMGQVYTLADRHDGTLPVLTVGGAAATGTTLTLTAAGVSKNITITATWTTTQAATGIAAAVRADSSYPLDATSTGPVVSFTWRLAGGGVSLAGTDATQTYALTFPATITTVATVPGNPALTGLPGAGAPVLTTLLTNKAKARPMLEWACDYTDSTSVSAIAAHIDTYSNGYYQRNERATWVSTDPLETAKLVLTSATPQLGNYWRTAVGVYQGAACQGGAYAAALAARLCATDLPYNQDGLQLQTGTLAPMLPGRSETDLSPTSQDVALGSYHLFPLVGVNGEVTLVRGKTTWGQSNTEWGDFSYGRIFDAVRYGMRAFLNSRFNGKVLFVGGGTVRVPNAFTIPDVKDAIGEYLDSQDGILVDNAKSLKQFIAAEPDPKDSSYIRIFLRERPPRENHIRSGVIAASA